MALQASGQISWSDIKTEFGGSDPIVVSDYYRGGSLVPDITQNANVPTSGAISISDFYGAQAAVDAAFDKASYSASDSESYISGPGVTSTSSISLLANGTITPTGSGTGSGGDYEDNGEIVETDFEVRAVRNSGNALTIGSENTWQALGSSAITYGVAISGAPAGTLSNTTNLTISIRRASDQVTVTTATVALSQSIININ